MTAGDFVLAVYVAAACVCVAVAAAAWHRRPVAWAARPLAVAMGVCALYAVAAVGVAAMTRTASVPAAHGVIFTWTLSSLLLWSGLLAPPFLCLCRAVSDHVWRPSRRLLALLAIQPAVVAAAVATDPWLHLVVARWETTPGDLWPRWSHGPLFWPASAVTYGVGAVGVAVLVRAMFNSRGVARRQLASVLVSALFPAVGGMLTASVFAGRTAPDLTPACLAVAGVLTAYALLRQQALRLVPVARSRVMDHLTDGVVVLDRLGRVLDVNPAARRLLVPGTRGLPAQLEAVADPAASAPGGGGVPSGEFPVDHPDGGMVLDVRSERMDDGHGRVLAEIVVIRDVTEWHTQRMRLAEANANLSRQIHTIDRLREELAEQAVRDPLTGLHNRRYLSRALGFEMARVRADGLELSLVVIDLDHFKRVNDEHGHDVGDAVLAAAADALRAGLRATDTLVRFGGEEFVALLPGAGLDTATERAEHLRAACRGIAVPGRDGPVRVTASAGVATARPGDNETTLLKAADEALYLAKAAGRDRVVLAGA